MGRVLTWVIVIGCLYAAYQTGLIGKVVDYFNSSFKKAQQEEVIENADGSITTVKYRSIFSPLINKDDN